MKHQLILLLFFISILTGCSEKQSADPKKCYEYWAGQEPSKEIRPVHAKYWQSANWSKEYIVYLELIASVNWKNQFIKQNHLTSAQNVELPSHAPAWFKLGKLYKLWKHPGDENSVYFEDLSTGHFFIYEQQL
jgi:hypothetical protein